MKLFLFSVFGVLIFGGCAGASPATAPANFSQPDGERATPVDWFIPYLTAINDTLTRVKPPLDAEIDKEINKKFVSINGTINDIHTKMDTLNSSINTRMTKFESDLNVKFVDFNERYNDQLDTINVKLDTKFDAMGIKLDAIMQEIKGTSDNLNEFKKEQRDQNKLVTTQLLLILAMVNKTTQPVTTTPNPPLHSLQQTASDQRPRRERITNNGIRKE